MFPGILVAIKEFAERDHSTLIQLNYQCQQISPRCLTSSSARRPLTSLVHPRGIPYC